MTTKRITTRQREVLQKLARKDGQSQFWLAPGHSGNVIEHLWALDMVRVEVTDKANLCFITPRGQIALATGRLPEEG